MGETSRPTALEIADTAWAKPGAKPVGVEILPSTAFIPQPISWLWRHWLARGRLHLLAGAPGTGKTTIAMSFAASLSSGGTWPDGEGVEPSDVLIWSGEDDLA